MANNTNCREDLKFAYEQSIIAYQKHVQRYGTWMNTYAIITGALMIAFYNIYNSDDSACKDNLEMLIVILGWISSLCWYGCVKGYYEWIKSFMSIVKHNEKIYFAKYGGDMPFVYSKVLISKTSCEVKDDYISGFFSTQKITLFFIAIVTLAWPLSIFILDGISVVACLLVAIPIILHIYSFVIQKLYLRCRFRCLIQRFLRHPVHYFHSTILPNEIIKL